MEIKKPLESTGWLSSMGYQVVVDEEAKRAAESIRKASADEQRQGTVEDDKDTDA